jgi:hypothetical protein
MTEKWDDGKFRFIVNRAKIFSATTLDEETFSCAAIWLGDHNVTCGARSDMNKKSFIAMRNRLVECFDKGQINEIIVGLSKYFGHNYYSLKDLFKDDQRYILDYIVTDGLKKAKDLFDIIYHDNSAMLRFMKETRVPLPKPLQAAADIVLNMELVELLSEQTPDLNELHKRIGELKNLSVTLDTKLLAYKASIKITDEFNKLTNNPENVDALKTVSTLIRTVRDLPIELDLWQAQNVAFEISQNQYKRIKQQGDEISQTWTKTFEQLCELIGIRLT